VVTLIEESPPRSRIAKRIDGVGRACEDPGVPGPPRTETSRAAMDSSPRSPITTWSRRSVLLVTWGVLAFSTLLPLVEVLRIAVVPEYSEGRAAAVVATAIYLPIHLRHVFYGVRGERAPYGGLTLAAMALVIVGTVPLVGVGWLLTLASLAASCLIVLRPRWSLVLFGATVAATYPLAVAFNNLPAEVDIFGWAGYLTVSVAWRSISLFVPVWLVVATRQLAAARRDLADEAVVRERLRIDQHLRTSVGAALGGILKRADRARQTASDDPTASGRELQAMVHDSRSALGEVRRLVAAYQEGSFQRERDHVLLWLEDAGMGDRSEVSR
jgi:two-component system sensor histidine kinase DesK